VFLSGGLRLEIIGSTDSIVPSTVVTEISSHYLLIGCPRRCAHVLRASVDRREDWGGDLANARLSSGIGRYVWASLWHAEFTTATCSPPKLSHLAVGDRIKRV